MNAGNVARLFVVLAAVVAAVGSASSNQNQSQSQAPQAAQYGQSSGGSPPPPQQMEAARALGVWRSTFGAVKIEADDSRGGLDTGSVQGVWVYQRQGQEVVGYFSGSLRGNVLQFKWQEPSNPPLTGEGYLVFDQQGRQYSGRWWSDRRDRVGDWNGWRSNGRDPRRGNLDRDDRGGAYGTPNDTGVANPEDNGDPDANPPGPGRDSQPRRPAQPAPAPAPGTYGPQPPTNYY